MKSKKRDSVLLKKHRLTPTASLVLRDKSLIASPRLCDRHLSLISARGSQSKDFSSQSVASLEILESQSGFGGDSVLGRHSADLANFGTTADSCSALKSTKSTTSNTAKRSFFRKQATAVQGGGTQAGFFSNSRILEEEKQAENKKTTDIQKVDSSKQAFLSSLRAVRSKAWQSIQTKTQSLESTFDNPTTAKTHKVDSRIFHNTAIFATAKKMDCHDFANAKSRNDGNRVFDTTPQDEKTESVFDKKSQAEGFSKETSANAERYPLFSRRGRRDLP